MTVFCQKCRTDAALQSRVPERRKPRLHDSENLHPHGKEFVFGAQSDIVAHDIYRHLWRPKVRYCVHKRLAKTFIQKQIDLVHSITENLFKIHFNIFFQITSKSSKRSRISGFLTIILYETSPFSLAYCFLLFLIFLNLTIVK
jgi:hypothetical protein